MVQELKKLNLKQKGNLQIAGLNGLLLGVAKEREIDGMCLLGEVPMYASRMPNPMAALAVLRTLSKMLEIEVDFVELARVAEETREKMKQAAAEAMGQYIDYFTQPIWEQGQEEEGDEGGEEEDEP
jgi:proteasome assembly chaperone (PAC2) family protein